WNHIEMEGAAWGTMSLLSHDLEKATDSDQTLFERPKGQERTFNQIDEPITGQKLRFTNVEQETPLGELSAYYVHPGPAPAGTAELKYKLTATVATDNPSLEPLV